MFRITIGRAGADENFILAGLLADQVLGHDEAALLVVLCGDEGPSTGSSNRVLNFNLGAALESVQELAVDGFTHVQTLAVCAVDPHGRVFGAFRTGEYRNHQSDDGHKCEYDADQFLHRDVPSFLS